MSELLEVFENEMLARFRAGVLWGTRVSRTWCSRASAAMACGGFYLRSVSGWAMPCSLAWALKTALGG